MSHCLIFSGMEFQIFDLERIGFGLCVCMSSVCARYRLETSCIDSSWKNSRCLFSFSNYLPLENYSPLKNRDERRTWVKPVFWPP